MSSERREYARFKKPVSAIIHRPYTEHTIDTANVSMGGIALNNCQRYYDINTPVYLEVIIPEAGSIFCDAIVTSTYPHTKDAQTYQVSLRFLDMPEKDQKKLEAYLRAK